MWVFEWPYGTTGSLTHAALPFIHIRRCLTNDYWAATTCATTGITRISLVARDGDESAHSTSTTTTTTQVPSTASTSCSTSKPSKEINNPNNSPNNNNPNNNNNDDDDEHHSPFLFQVIVCGDKFALRHVASQSWVMVNSDNELCLRPIAGNTDSKTRVHVAQSRRVRANHQANGDLPVVGTLDINATEISWDLDDSYLFALYTKVAFQCSSTKRFVSVPKTNPQKPIKVGARIVAPPATASH
jgi:hypothetical protein